MSCMVYSFCSFSCDSMPVRGCLALHGVNPNSKKNHLMRTSCTNSCIQMERNFPKTALMKLSLVKHIYGSCLFTFLKTF